MKTYYVYILASHSRALYVGITSDLVRRMYQHKHRHFPGFTARYNIDRLVYFEDTFDVSAAIERESAIKRWSRKKKLALIETVNPGWHDLSASWQLD